MEAFDLGVFLADPSMDRIDRCRKADLYAIAAHFEFPVQGTLIKARLKECVVDMLVGKEMLGVTVASPCSDASADMQAGAEAKPPATLPRFNPLSPTLSMSSQDARLKVRLARLQMEAERGERQAEREHQLEIQRIEAEKEVKLRRLELEAASAARSTQTTLSSPLASSFGTLDVTKQMALVPQFRESEIDSYFGVFERIAVSMQWPKEVWPLLLQCKLSGKAQEVLASISLEDSLDYEIVKTTVLRAYELVPEAYRQKFRSCKKSPDRTFMEFAREKATLFDRWCTATKTTDFSSLRELVLLEEFKNIISERIVTYLNEQKVMSLSQAALLADEFVLSHKPAHVFSTSPSTQFRKSVSLPLRPREGGTGVFLLS